MLKDDFGLNCQPRKSGPHLCLNLKNFVTPHLDYFDQNFTKLKYNDALSLILFGAINLILTHTQTSQVLDCIQKSSIIELEIWIVRHQSTVSYWQVIETVSGPRTHIPISLQSSP